MSPRHPLASDGLRARKNGSYARVKLEFLDRYLPFALNATKKKRRRVYLDLFAGPGINIDVADEFPSGALRALSASGPGSGTSFTDAVLVNLDAADHRALSERVEGICTGGQSRVSMDRIQLVNGDANESLPAILEGFHPKDYLMVFADIEAPKQLPFVTLEALRAEHTSVDLYVLFPLDMAVTRLVAYNPRRRREWGPVLDSFFGTNAWTEIADELRTNPGRRAELGRQLTGLYCRQLGTLWEEAGVVADVYLRKRQRLYQMVFASSHIAAGRIKTSVKLAMDQSAGAGQGELF